MSTIDELLNQLHITAHHIASAQVRFDGEPDSELGAYTTAVLEAMVNDAQLWLEREQRAVAAWCPPVEVTP